MTRDEAIERLNIHKSTNVFVDSIAEAIDMAIEALSAEEAVWNEYEAEFTDLPDIPRYYYEKVVGKMAHEINVLKEQLESAEAEWIPCSERLPSKNQEVLLQCHHNMIVGYWMDGDFDGEKEWRALSGDGWENGCDFPTDVFEPLAWMPLPKPYSEESEI